MSEAPHRTIRKFNPGVFQPDADIVEQFVVRRHELNTVLEILRDNIGGPSCQHTLVIGPRGRGKTMLLARVAAELRSDPQLRSALLPVRFMEESFEVFDIGDFWLEALHYLARECTESRPDISAELDATRAALARRARSETVAEQARATLLDAADRLGRQLVLMVENLQNLCEDVEDGFGWQLRGSLQTDAEIILLSTATTRFEALDDVRDPFFELFRILHLEPLGTADCQRLWEVITGEKREIREMRPLEILTGGSPRLLVIVGEFARHRTVPKLLEELVGLVDDHSEYFRGNMESLPRTERRVFAALADLWAPSSTRAVADRARMGVRTTSALLGRLTRRGAVKAKGSGRRRLYAVREPLHSVYYKLRRRRDEAAVVHGLIRFMVAFYGPDATEDMLGSLLADKSAQAAFLQAEGSEEAHSGDFPTSGVKEAYRALVKRFRNLGSWESQKHVATEMFSMGARLLNGGEAQRAIEFCDELIERFGSSSIPAVQVSLARAYFNKAVATEQAGGPGGAVEHLDRMISRFEASGVPDIQECVARALLNKGFLHGELGDHAAAIASYDEASSRFGHSDHPGVRECVAMALLNKGSTQARAGSPNSMQTAVSTWDDINNRFGKDTDPDVQVQVVRALTKKAGACIKMGRSLEGIGACDEAVLRYRGGDGLELRREVAGALELRALCLNGMRRGREALEACDTLIRDYGDIEGQRGIPVSWRALGSQVHALVLEGEESEAVRVFKVMCDDLDVADGEMLKKVVWDTIDLIAAGADPSVFADALEESADDSAELVPLLAALRRLAEQNRTVPKEFEKAAEDIVRKIGERRS